MKDPNTTIKGHQATGYNEGVTGIISLSGKNQDLRSISGMRKGFEQNLNGCPSSVLHQQNGVDSVVFF